MKFNKNLSLRLDSLHSLLEQAKQKPKSSLSESEINELRKRIRKAEKRVPQ